MVEIEIGPISYEEETKKGEKKLNHGIHLTVIKHAYYSYRDVQRVRYCGVGLFVRFLFSWRVDSAEPHRRPMGKGLLTGALPKLDDIPTKDHRRMFSRFKGEVRPFPCRIRTFRTHWQ